MIGRRTSVNARAWRRWVARASIRALVASAAVAPPTYAQAALTRIEDAAPVPRGVARLRIVPSWSRFDARFHPTSGAASTVPLASVLAADSLGVAQIPALAPSEEALRTLTGDPAFRLSLGQSVSRGTARVVTTAFAAEYGLTRRLTLRAVLPVVQSQTELFVAVNPDGSDAANVGPNPARIQSAQRAQAVTLQQQLGNARTTLQTRLTACEQNPAADPSCPTILANRADVQSLISETAAFGSALATLYGTATSVQVQPFAARAGTTTAAAITARLATLRDRLRGYVGSSADQIVATVPFAVGPAGFGDVRQLLLAGEFGLWPDSLGQVYRINIGDIELGARFLAFESGAWPPTSDAPTAWLRTRAAVSAVVRLGTGAPTRPRMPYRYLEYGTGDGQTDVEAGALIDLGLGPRVLVTSALRYAMQLGEVDAGRIPDDDGVVNPFVPIFDGRRRLGDVLMAEVTPRYLVGRWFAADAHYALIMRGDDEYAPVDGGAPLLRGGFTEQRVGLGISYSTLRGARGGRLARVPIEASFAHIRTLTGSSALVPRTDRTQLEVGVYYRLRR
jgi:hypothetical protein